MSKDKQTVMLLRKTLSCYLRNYIKLITKLTSVFLLVYIIPVYAEVTVTDDLHNTIEINQPVKSIITLSPHLTELVFTAGAGHLLAATVDHSDYPEQAKKIPSLGPFNKWDIEQIILLKPDIVFAWQTANGDAPIEKLKKLGIPVYVSEPRGVEDIADTIQAIGKIAGTQTESDRSSSKFLGAINVLREQYQHKQPVKVFYQVWSNPLMTINGQQLVSELIRLCGGVNIYHELPVLAPVVTLESLIQRNPEVMIGGAVFNDQADWLEDWRKLASVQAVRNKQLYFIDPDLLNRQTVRMAEGAKLMCQAIDMAREFTDD